MDARASNPEARQAMSWLLLLYRQFIEAGPISRHEKWLSPLACLTAILLTSTLTHSIAPQETMLIGSMGASAAILFVAHGSPLAQPWPFLGSHLLSGLIGIYTAHYIPDTPLACASAVSLSVLSMLLFRCLHPPGAATALVPVLNPVSGSQPHFEFLIAPLGLNVILLLLLAVIINRLILHRTYPQIALNSGKPCPAQKKPVLLDIGTDDIDWATDDMKHYLDVSADDLLQIFSRLQILYAQRHLGATSCGDILQHNIIWVEYATEIESAWLLMHSQHLTVLPVLDNYRRVIGIVTRYDFLKNLNMAPHSQFQQRWINFIKRTPAPHTNKPEAIGQIMTRDVKTLAVDSPIAALIPLIVDEGHHHIPIVDAQQRFVGMVFQRGLLAALFNQYALTQAPNDRLDTQ